MENNLRVFESPEFGSLGVLMIDGNPYFPATECATLLGYSRPHNAVERHCRYSLKQGVPHPQSPGKTIQANFIPESDLYRLIMRSKLPKAIEFEKWVVEVVLPSIRKHGVYISDEILQRMRESEAFANDLLERLACEKEKRNELANHLERLAPKARYFDTILRCPQAVQVSIIAKDYGMSAVKFNKLLRKMGVQYKVGNTWLLYQKYANNGFTVTNTYAVNGKVTAIHTCWTQRGRFWLYEMLKANGYMPEIESDAA